MRSLISCYGMTFPNLHYLMQSKGLYDDFLFAKDWHRCYFKCLDNHHKPLEEAVIIGHFMVDNDF